MKLFAASGLVRHFGGLCVTDHVDLEIEPGEVHALIGPNGAGKTTLIHLISGLLRPQAGRVVLNGVDITRLAAHRRVQAGLSRCFQITNLFQTLSVRDNLRLAVQAHEGHSFGLLGHRDHERLLNERSESLAEQVGLGASLDRPADSLAHGAQRQLDIALALAARPRLLLLDEPMAGMGPDESARVVELIQTLRSQMAILLVEHDMDAVFKLADRLTVLVYGKVLACGDAASVRANPAVQAVYLGG